MLDDALPGERDEAVVVSARCEPRRAIRDPLALRRPVVVERGPQAAREIHLLNDGWREDRVDALTDGLHLGSLSLFQKVAVGREHAHLAVNQEHRGGAGVEQHRVQRLVVPGFAARSACCPARRSMLDLPHSLRTSGTAKL